jgi:dihydroorotase/N-acyl-D-amino-acid deacylase
MRISVDPSSVASRPRPIRKAAFALLALQLSIGVAAQSTVTTASTEPFDIVIVNGHVMDGTGSPWYSGDIGIRAGHIAAIGNLANSARKQTIDAKGKIVAPGFIDMLGQSELTMLVEPKVPSKIFQGITTEVTGEGNSAAPVNAAMIAADRAGYEHLHIQPDWTTFREFFTRLERQGMGINLASYVGATSVRRMVLADADVQPTPDQLARMQALVDHAMEDGAVGVSSALQYAPAPYARTEELIALAREAAKYGGIYATHMRSEGDAEPAAIDEAVRIGREAHIPVEIWHLKAAGKSNWGHMPQIVAQIDAARASGVDISANTYAYTAWFNTFSAFIPPWAHDGGDEKLIERLKNPETRARIRKDMLSTAGTWDNEWQEIPGPEAILIAVVQNPELIPLQGKRLSEVAALWKEDPIDALCDLLIKDNAFTEVAVFGMSEPDVVLALKQPWVSVDNDSQGTSPEGLLGQEHPHPRAYGTFPRILRKYVREEHALTLEDAIRKFTALPAQRMRFTDRGVLKQGMWADVVIFDPATIRDLATFEQPNQLSQGMEYVLVNGVPVIAAGKMTGALPGKVLRGPGYQPMLAASRTQRGTSVGGDRKFEPAAASTLLVSGATCNASAGACSASGALP